MPKENGSIVPKQKKGNRMEYANYRGNSTAKCKTLSWKIMRKLNEYIEDRLGEYLFGLKQGKSTVDAISMTNQIIEKWYEQNIEIQMLLMDFKQIFDNLKREMLSIYAQKMRIPDKLYD